MSWSVLFGLKAWNFVPFQTPPFPPAQTSALSQKTSSSSYERARKHCWLTTSKPAGIQFCLQEAKRRLKRPPAPAPKPKTDLERERGRCNSLGKTTAIQACKREAPKRVEARRKAATNSSSTQRHRSHCNSMGKTVAVLQCRRSAPKR